MLFTPEKVQRDNHAISNNSITNQRSKESIPKFQPKFVTSPKSYLQNKNIKAQPSLFADIKPKTTPRSRNLVSRQNKVKKTYFETYRSVLPKKVQESLS